MLIMFMIFVINKNLFVAFLFTSWCGYMMISKVTKRIATKRDNNFQFFTICVKCCSELYKYNYLNVCLNTSNALQIMNHERIFYERNSLYMLYNIWVNKISCNISYVKVKKGERGERGREERKITLRYVMFWYVTSACNKSHFLNTINCPTEIGTFAEKKTLGKRQKRECGEL